MTTPDILMFAQQTAGGAAVDGPATWVNTGALGLLALFVGYLLKKLVPAIEELGKKMDNHMESFGVLLREERSGHAACIDKVCETFKAEIRAEREAGERRVAQLVELIRKGVISHAKPGEP